MSNLIAYSEMEQMAEAIAASGLFGMKDKNSVLALMAVAQSEGLHPATAARDFHIIQGRPALKADAMLARFQNAGGKVEWKEYTDEKVTGLFSHPNGGELSVSWTIEQAQRIGLVKPGSGWQKFPRAMLRSRCISEGIRSVFPGSVTGFYTPEEVETFAPPKDLGKVDQVTGEIELSEIAEDIPDSIALYVPNQEQAYERYANIDEWMDGFVNLSKRIYDSPKLDTATKLEKHNALRDCNATFMKSWNGSQTAKLLEKIANSRRT
jgi:RecT family